MAGNLTEGGTHSYLAAIQHTGVSSQSVCPLSAGGSTFERTGNHGNHQERKISRDDAHGGVELHVYEVHIRRA